MGTFHRSFFNSSCCTRGEEVCSKIQRIFKIWEKRNVYSSSFVQQLIVLLESTKNAEAKPTAVDGFSNFEVKYF